MIISKSPVGKYMVGIDLTDTYCQVSWLYNKRARFGRGFVNAATGGVSREPLTYSKVPGQEAYNIPATLCKRKDSAAWLAGPEAEETARAGEGTAVTGLLRKAREDAKRIPIIALTANAFDEDVQRSLQAGMNAHLTKPIEPASLYQALGELIYEAENA